MFMYKGGVGMAAAPVHRHQLMTMTSMEQCITNPSSIYRVTGSAKAEFPGLPFTPPLGDHVLTSSCTLENYKQDVQPLPTQAKLALSPSVTIGWGKYISIQLC